MAEPFGRGSRSSSIRYQSGGSCCTTNKKRLRSSKLETAVKRQAPPIKEKYSPLKAGTEKAQGSGSGASKQSPKFKTYRRRREKDHQSPKEHYYHHQQVLPFLVHHQYLQNAQPQQDQNQHLYQGLHTQQQQPRLHHPRKDLIFHLLPP